MKRVKEKYIIVNSIKILKSWQFVKENLDDSGNDQNIP